MCSCRECGGHFRFLKIFTRIWDTHQVLHRNKEQHPEHAELCVQVGGGSHDEEAPAQAAAPDSAAQGTPSGAQQRDGLPEAGRAEPGPGSVVLARLSRLRKVYGRHVAVHDLSLHLCMGEVTALLGHNGAGESQVFVLSYASHEGLPRVWWKSRALAEPCAFIQKARHVRKELVANKGLCACQARRRRWAC